MKILADWDNNDYLPKAHTCEGVGNFPTLTIKEIPLSAQCLVLIVDDPDAPGGTWDHLLIANISIVAQTMDIGEHDLFKGLSGQNSWGDLGRGAPCPPSGVHRYIFKVYAIKHLLELSSGFTKEGLLEKMQGNIVAEAEIIGLYQKSL
ncbi:MAG: YbhB/YbcL family Raf kinase inhibitor-like protein [candidate division SR1 bacterium]|nr:YbhB/YbcL family Raf kinase inhibitor-like protein [candidate division SR1 bacterium]